MELLYFDAKKLRCSDEVRSSTRIGDHCTGILWDDVIVVPDVNEANFLNESGCYGSFINQRIPRTSLACFKPTPSNVVVEEVPYKLQVTDASVSESVAKETVRSEADRWKEQHSSDKNLYLSLEEAFYLAAELGILHVKVSSELLSIDALWKRFLDNYGSKFLYRYIAYRYLRLQNWIVRSGMPFGTDFLIYLEGPKNYHSSAGVKVLKSAECKFSAEFIALNRELNNVKKSFVCVLIDIPSEVQIQDPHCVNDIIVSQVTYRYLRPEEKANL